jgi:hypothetical protein
MSKAKSIYYVEVTDTYGGEANYSWVKRFKVHASSIQGAIRKVSTTLGMYSRKAYDTGDMIRYDFKGVAICAFVSGYEDQAEYLYVDSI